jgi:hypothetical protein
LSKDIDASKRFHHGEGYNVEDGSESGTLMEVVDMIFAATMEG